MRYLTISELIYINGRVLNDTRIMTGKQKIRDVDLLEAAVARPSASAFGEDAYPTLTEKVAALLHSVARNHPFKDGNKRTAVVAAIFMFCVNGQRVAWDAEEALKLIVEVAEGKQDVATLAAWFPLTDGEAMPQEDAERDTAVIDEIVHEHRWLLNELERR